MFESLGASIPIRVWRPLMTIEHAPRGAIATRQAPLLALGEISEPGRPWSSILYPAGMRTAIQSSLGGTFDEFKIRPGGDVDATRHPEFARLCNDMARFSELEPGRQAEVLACLNCVTEQHLVLGLAGSLGEDHFTEPNGCHAVYETARALIRARPHDPQSRMVLWRLASQSVDPAVGAVAAIQLGAASIRIDNDLEAASKALAAAEVARSVAPSSIEDLLASRFFRLHALWALKAQEFRTARQAMQDSYDTSEQFVAASAGRHPYLDLVARENHKIVLESHLKAASGIGDIASFQRWAVQLLTLDPEDAYTWRYIASYGARCGLLPESGLALAGLVSMGGLGAMEVLESLRNAPTDSPEAPDLRAALQEALANLQEADSDSGVTVSRGAN